MPVHVEHRNGEWHIVEDATGKTVGRSTTKKKASIAAAIRNQKHREKMRDMDLQDAGSALKFFLDEGFTFEKSVDLTLHLCCPSNCSLKKG